MKTCLFLCSFFLLFFLLTCSSSVGSLLLFLFFFHYVVFFPSLFVFFSCSFVPLLCCIGSFCLPSPLLFGKVSLLLFLAFSVSLVFSLFCFFPLIFCSVFVGFLAVFQTLLIHFLLLLKYYVLVT